MPDDRRSTPLTGRPTLLAAVLDGAERYIETHVARLLLSTLILLSLLPLDELLQHAFALRAGTLSKSALDLLFFCVFAPEFGLRLVVHLRRRRLGDHTRGESFLLFLDLLATLSFLPVWSFMRLSVLRLVRMVLLLGYWGGMLGDLMRVLGRRERRFQVLFVLLLGLVLSFTGAVLLRETGRGVDASGAVTGDTGQFPNALWWAFRQVEDPGNLVDSLDDFSVAAISVVLTFAGLLLFSFLIGIGTGAIDELLERSRLRPVGLRQHTVVLGLGRHTHFLLTEFAHLYRKNRRRLRAAVLGHADDPDRALGDELLRDYRYRKGDPVAVSDLERVDVGRAKRVIILGTDEDNPDESVISAILATRDRNPRVHLYPDLDHASSLAAARTAGGRRTHVIGSGSFLGDYIAQNVVHPGVYRLYRQLLTASGCEIYTYLFSAAEREALAKSGATIEPRVAHRYVFEEFGVTTLGYFVADPALEALEVEDFEVLLHPSFPSHQSAALTPGGGVRRDHVRGVIGVCLRWRDLQRAALGLAGSPSSLPARPPAPTLPGLKLSLAAPRAERVLICGGSARVPRVISELLKFYGAFDVTVLVREKGRAEALVAELVSKLQRTRPGWSPPGRAECGVSPDEHGVCIGIALGDDVARVHVAEIDWSDVTRVARNPYVDLERTDVMLFLPSRSVSRDIDGLVALGCLKMAQAEVTRAMTFPPAFRVIGVMNDPVKGDLLERRLDAMTSSRPETTFTIICGERIRHWFTVQNVFVRGLSQVCLELLDAGRQGFCRIIPSVDGATPHGGFEFEDLAALLLDQHKLLLLGVELRRTVDGGEVILDPFELRKEGEFAWDDVAALYVLGDGRRLQVS